MIFLCVGSREYQFDRLIKELDQLVGNGTISDEVIGQIGASNYIPKNFSFERFMSANEFEKYQKQADLIISHAGTGSLINSLKLGKQVVSVPRLLKYNEHTDNHQLEVSKALADEGLLIEVLDISLLGQAILNLQKHPINKKYNKPSNVLPIILDFIKDI